MHEYFEVDNNGNIIGNVLLDENGEIPKNHFKGWGQDVVFYKPIYDFSLNKWVENLSQEEIDAINNHPKIPTQEEYMVDLDYRLSMVELGL